MTAAEFLQRRWITDGAMATYLHAKGAPRDRPVEELNLTRPGLIAAVHLEYLDAGAQIIRANTFTASPATAAGVSIAREAAQGRALVAGVIGSRIDGDRPHFRQHAANLQGVDLIVLETFRDIAELGAAVDGVRDVIGHSIPLVAQLSVDPDGTHPEGLQDLDADVIGFNCSFGPESVWRAFERLRALTSRPLSASPSTGRPSLSPESFAPYARRFFDAGACMVGACCGSTPEHIRRIRAVANEHATLVSQWPQT
jgi:methionine synthase I (cobalamin-dependent)